MWATLALWCSTSAMLVPPRPLTAHGTFLRLVSINDVYALDNLPRVATCVAAARAASTQLDCVVSSHMNGDFLSPCMLSAMDGGRAMMRSLGVALVDFASLGNHEFDIGFEGIEACLGTFEHDGRLGTCPTVVNSNAVAGKALRSAPQYATIDVGERSILIGGFTTADLTIYNPSAAPQVTPVLEACVQLWEERKGAGDAHAVFLPMTHQTIAEDRELADALAQHADLGKVTPVILGGHEHVLMIEEVASSLVVKAGQDAETVAIVDIWWTASGELRQSVSAMPASCFEPEPSAHAFVASQQRFLDDMMRTPIATVRAACSSKRVRYEPSELATFLLTLLRRGLVASGVELVLLQGGAFRGKAEYAAGQAFTLGDLYAEFGFDTQQAIIELPGDVLAASIANSRHGEGEKPNYLHADDGCAFDAAHRLTHVNGRPFDPERTYCVSIYHFLLTGMNAIEPLVSYVQQRVELPPLDSCLPAKEIALSVCVRDAWARVLRQEGWDTNGDGTVDDAELAAAVRRAFGELDSNADGYISESELRRYLAGGEDATMDVSEALVARLIALADTDGDGRISMEELAALACSIRNESGACVFCAT